MSLTNIDGLLTGIDVEPTLSPIAHEPEHVEPEPSEVLEPVDEVATSVPEAVVESDTDDYGSPVSKKERLYTEAELNERIRDRLSRGQYAQQQQQQAASVPTPQYEPNPEVNENWEAQLEGFIESTLSKRDQKQAEENWRRQEQETQHQFEMKFNQGAARYNDFDTVVQGKALTPQMVIATRGMADPAAFIYAAAKTQAPELEKIARLTDPYHQAVELGKLEERMRRSKSGTSSAPKPLDAIKGDVVDKVTRKESIDDILRKEAEVMRKQGRR